MAYSCFIAFAEPHPGSLTTEDDVDFAVITHPQKIRFITSSYSTNIQLILCQFQWSLISLKHIPPQLVHEPLTSTVAFFQPTFDPHRGAP